MANANMNFLMDYLRVRLPGATDAAIQLEMFAILDEFLSQTSVWKEDIDFAVVPGTLSYDIVPTTGTPIRLAQVTNSSGIGVPGYMATPGTVVFPSDPQVSDTYTATIILSVIEPITREGYPDFPDWILARHWRTIADGVLGAMMSQIAKPYTSQTAAVFHLRKYRNEVAIARVGVSRLNVHRGQSWQFPVFA